MRGVVEDGWGWEGRHGGNIVRKDVKGEKCISIVSIKSNIGRITLNYIVMIIPNFVKYIIYTKIEKNIRFFSCLLTGEAIMI